MKKLSKGLMGVFLLFAVVIAFSGMVSASYVTDKQKKTTYDNIGANVGISKVIHYSSSHIRFDYVNYCSDGQYMHAIRDYKKTSQRTIIERNYVTWNGNRDMTLWYGPRYKKINTKASVYTLYKQERARYGYGIAGVFGCV
jgi:hypothetical protein